MPLSFLRHFPVRALLVIAVALGAAYYAQAQTPDEARRVADRALEARRSNFRSDGTFTSPHGDYVVVDLGEREFYNGKRRSQVVYDFEAKKVFILRFDIASNDIEIDSESLR